MFDPYAILNVSHNDDVQTFKTAYRRLSLQWHPDKNPDNKEEAESKFKDINKAYKILSDTQLRAEYDRTGNVDEIDQTRFGNNRFSCFDGLFYDMDDILPEDKAPETRQKHPKANPVFLSPDGSPTSPSAEDPNSRTRIITENQYTLKLSLKELMTGCMKSIWVNNNVVCPVCRGDGQINASRKGMCTLCYGGNPMCPQCQGSFESFMASHMGEKAVMCGQCGGRGCVRNKLKQKIRIPAGIEDRFTTHIDARSGPPILVQCMSELPPAWSRRGSDLCYSISINYQEVVCGAKRRMMLPDGEQYTIHVPGVIKAGVVWRIEGRGLPHPQSPETRGDIVLNFIIKWPHKVWIKADWESALTTVPKHEIKALGITKITHSQKDVWTSVIKSFDK
jgi:molecular chaperone DnaJ